MDSNQMRTLTAPSKSIMATLAFPRLTLFRLPSSNSRLPPISQTSFHLRHAFSPFAILPVLPLGISTALGSIWESILRAVPKKKTTHSKKRHRQMAGKALQDVTSLNKCSACGNVKRAHLLCPYCVQGEQTQHFGRFSSGQAKWLNFVT